MKNYENTFVHDPSPSFSDEVLSDTPNTLTATLPIDMKNKISPHKTSISNEVIEAKFNEIYVKSMKQGRHTFTFWTIFIVMLVLTVGNLILTLTIMGVLKFGKGIRGMELIPEEDVIKFYGETDLDRIYLKAVAQLNGFSEVPVSVTSDNSAVYIRLNRNGQTFNRIVFDNSGIQLKGMNTFDVKDSVTGNNVFTTHRPHYNLPLGAEVLKAKSVSSTKISSSIHEELSIVSDGKISVRGSEGILIDAFGSNLQAEHHISVNSSQSAIILESGDGIFLDMEKTPIVSSEFGLRTGNVQYKVCVCMPQGTLFRIAIPRVHNGPKVSCAHFESKQDPCTIN